MNIKFLHHIVGLPGYVVIRKLFLEAYTANYIMNCYIMLSIKIELINLNKFVKFENTCGVVVGRKKPFSPKTYYRAIV